ncbi:MAG: hypothetical protein V3V22_06290 [Methylococcales bacterium]
MRIQKKWPIAIATVGLVGLGFLLYTQTSNQENTGNVNETFVTMRSPEKQRHQKRLESSTNASSVKLHVNNNSVVHNSDSTEVFDEMEMFDDSTIGIHLRTHFNILEDTETGAQERQDESLKKMHETPEIFVTKLIEAYDGLDRVNFLAKYKILYIMENLRSIDAIPFLSELANSDFPEETAPYAGDGHADEAHNEGLIRMRAVGGLNALAIEGNPEARNSLLDVAMNAKDRTVKNDAIRAYLSSSKDLDADKDHLKAVLPDTDHQFITIKFSDIKDARTGRIDPSK